MLSGNGVNVDRVKTDFQEICKNFRKSNIELDQYDSNLDKIYRLRAVLKSLSISYDLELTLHNLNFQEQMLLQDRKYFKNVIDLSIRKLLYDIFHVNRKIGELCNVIRELNKANINLKVDVSSILRCHPSFNIMTKNRFSLIDIEKIFEETIFNITVLDEIMIEFGAFLKNLMIGDIEIGNLNLSMTTQFNKLFLEYNRQVAGLKEIVEYHKTHMFKTVNDHSGILNNRKHGRNKLREIVTQVMKKSGNKADALEEEEVTLDQVVEELDQDVEESDDSDNSSDKLTNVINKVAVLQQQNAHELQQQSENLNNDHAE